MSSRICDSIYTPSCRVKIYFNQPDDGVVRVRRSNHAETSRVRGKQREGNVEGRGPFQFSFVSVVSSTKTGRDGRFITAEKYKWRVRFRDLRDGSSRIPDVRLRTERSTPRYPFTTRTSSHIMAFARSDGDRISQVYQRAPSSLRETETITPGIPTNLNGRARSIGSVKGDKTERQGFKEGILRR